MIESGDGQDSKLSSYERIVLKNASEYYYLKIHLEFQEVGISLNAVEFKQLIVSALKLLHGEVGAALPVDVLSYEEKNLFAILRVPIMYCNSLILSLSYLLSHQSLSKNLRVSPLLCSDLGLVKLWSALTLFDSYQNRKCAFRVTQTSPFLLALAGNSRELVLD